jgi:hypothetical protein
MADCACIDTVIYAIDDRLRKSAFEPEADLRDFKEYFCLRPAVSLDCI